MARVEMIIDSIRQELLYYQWVVIIKENLGERCLPIYVSSPQGEIIRSLLVGTEPVESLDFDFSVPGVDTGKVDIKSVIVNRFKNNIFYAKLLFTHNKKSYKIDYPLAKAIALSVGLGVPILAEEALLNKAAIDVKQQNSSCPHCLS